MSQLYQWDDEKATSNLRKHQIGFEEAKTIFNDEFLITIYDEAHSDAEDRFISIGVSNAGRVLVVIHTDENDVIRIISCRKATTIERIKYEQE